MTSVAEIRIGLFLEDVGHERFLLTLIRRLALDVGFTDNDLIFDTRNATGGKGRATNEFRRFVRDAQRGQEHYFDVLVVAIDGNCLGYNDKRHELEGIAERSGYPREIVYAVPDPHIERWYLEDVSGLSEAIGEPIHPNIPPYKCERSRYKDALRDALRQADIYAPLGGIEYGADLVEYLDLYTVAQADTGFRHFVDELRGCLTRLYEIARG